MNSVIAKRLWNVLRIAFFMIRKGLISKRKLMMDMNMFMKRGKLLRKSLSNLIHHHHHHHSKQVTRTNFGMQEYEFSCSNSPNPVFFHVSKRKHHYFPCINTPDVMEDYPEEHKAVVLVPKTPEYTFNFQFDASDYIPGETRSPLLSPFAVRVSNYSSEDENDAGNVHVDNEAEEFIKKFYQQLRVQSRMQFLEYQETQYQ